MYKDKIFTHTQRINYEARHLTITYKPSNSVNLNPVLDTT